MTVQQYYAHMAILNRRDKMDTELFLQGQRDCRDGIEHRSGKGESYDRGYSTQYTHEQNMEAMSRG